jgi:hypothetical protein
MSETVDNQINPQNDEDIEYIRIGNTTYRVKSFYDGDMSFFDLIKNALKRDADAVLRQMDNA